MRNPGRFQYAEHEDYFQNVEGSRAPEFYNLATRQTVSLVDIPRGQVDVPNVFTEYVSNTSPTDSADLAGDNDSDVTPTQLTAQLRAVAEPGGSNDNRVE